MKSLIVLALAFALGPMAMAADSSGVYSSPGTVYERQDMILKESSDHTKEEFQLYHFDPKAICSDCRHIDCVGVGTRVGNVITSYKVSDEAGSIVIQLNGVDAVVSTISKSLRNGEHSVGFTKVLNADGTAVDKAKPLK